MRGNDLCYAGLQFRVPRLHMFELTIALILFVLLWVALSQIHSLTRRVEQVAAREAELARLLQSAISRIYRLEKSTSESEAVSAAPPVMVVYETSERQEFAAPAAEAVSDESAGAARIEREFAAAPPPSGTLSAAPTAPQDWEARIGGSWLNRLGALVLVIGIALFLGYSLTQLGPAGKVAIGYAVGISMLGAGVALERSTVYRNFALGLIGGGWAGIYFTTYALHGLPAARIVYQPTAAAALLLAVSALIVLHSFRYRSEVVTGLASLTAFVSLNLSPLTGFTVVATLFLAVALVLIAHRFAWFRLAVAGAVLTYGTFALTYEPAVYGVAGLLNGQAVLWMYWLVFEAFDLMDLRRRAAARGLERTLFGLNAFGFVAASILHEWAMSSTQWALFFACAAAAYLASAALRARMLPPDPAADLASRLFSGGYEAASAFSAALAAAAIIQRFSGWDMPVALLLEGELIVLAGFALRDRFLRLLGALVLVLPVVRLLIVLEQADRVVLLGFSVSRWSLVAFLVAGTFLINRALTRDGLLYSIGAVFLLLIATHKQIAREWLAVVWAASALGLIAGGLRRDSRELRYGGYLIAALAFARAITVNLLEPQARILTCAAVVLCFYAGQRLLRGAAGLDGAGRFGLSAWATGVLTLLLYQEVQGRLLTVAWGVEGAALLIAGFVVRDRILRLSGLALFLVCIGRLFLHDLRELDTLSRILSFVVLGLMLLAASWAYTRFREQIRRLL
ncbi:MAG: DUF2339 domain-containing protein [Acidobacteria bacterium]|nr:DUF2339 domain-containing protein [Acidobacteriota bacterium]